MAEMPIAALPVPHAEPTHAMTRATMAPAYPSAGAQGGQRSIGSIVRWPSAVLRLSGCAVAVRKPDLRCEENFCDAAACVKQR